MENILKRNKPNREADLDLELEIEEALKNFEYQGTYDRDDLSEYSISATPRRDLNHSVSDSLNFDSQAFNELRRANQEVDQHIFQPIESEIRKMRNANRGEFLDYDYEQMEEKPFVLHNELIPENKVEEIRQQIITTQAPDTGSSAFNNIKANNFMLDEEPEIIIQEDVMVKPQTPEKSERDEEDLRIARRMEKAQRDQEIWRMEKEDARSMKYERFLQQEKFKNRLFNLPESFPIYKETVLRSTNLSSNINPRGAKFTFPTIMRPIANPKENLVETSKTQIEKMALNKITNKVTKRLNYRKITEKDKLLLSKNTFNPSKSRVLDDKENNKTLASLQNTKVEYHPSDLLIKISSNTSNLATWVLDKSSHLNLKFAKMEISKVKIDLGNDKAGLPKTLFTQSKAPIFDSELEMEMELESNQNNDAKDLIKSLDYFMNQIPEKKGIQNLELKMENLKDVNGIQQLPDLQNLVLSMNKIQEIKGLNTLKYLTDIDLSQNNIKSMRGLSNLSYLRNLNLEVNSITKIEDLEGCISLEVLNLSNNQITQFEGLSDLKKLKKLLLFRNKITNTEKIEQLTYLEELDLGRNNIRDISFIQKLPVLRKLVVYFNQIDKLPLNLSHITLSEMWLNGNKLEDISNLAYFPSLKLLNLQENDIKILSKDSFVFIPNLKHLNLSFNKIESFGEIYRLLNSFPSIQHIDLNENPFIRSITETLGSFYEDILLTLLPNLGEINSKVIPFSQRNRVKVLTDRETWRTLPLNSNRLEDDMYHVDRFTSSKVNNRYKSFFFTQKSQVLAKTKMGPYYLSQISTIPKEDLYVLNHEYSCGIHHSNLKLKTSLHKIRSMLVKYICKKRTYKRYMQKNLAKIIQIQAFYKGYCLRKIFDVRRRLQEKRRQQLFNSKGKYALRIQKVYRGYLVRRRMKDLFKGIKYDDDEFDEFKDADMSFLNKGPDLDAFTLKLPGNMDLNQFIPTFNPQNFMQMSPNNPVLRPIENKKSPPTVSFQDQDEEKQDNDDAFSVSSANTSKSIQTIRLKQGKPPVPKGLNKEQKAELINDWGFKEENSQAFEFWAKKKLRPKEKAKPLDAEARLQKFYRNAQK